MGLRLGNGISPCSLLFGGVDYKRPSLNPTEMLQCNVNLTVYLLVCREIPCCTEVVRDSGLYAWKWGV